MESMYVTLALTIIESVEAIHVLQSKSADTEPYTDSIFFSIVSRMQCIVSTESTNDRDTVATASFTGSTRVEVEHGRTFM